MPDNAQENSTPERTFPLNSIYFYLCGDCNLACRHCWISPKYQQKGTSSQALDPGLMFNIITQARPLGLQTIKLTGGEPLIHPGITGILERVRDEKIGLVVETNGVAMTSRIAGLIRECEKPFCSVSIDGTSRTHDKIRGVKGSFEDACRGAKYLSDAGVPLQIIMTVMRANKDEIDDVVSIAADLGAESIKFNFVQPTERGELMHTRGETLSVPELIELGTWMERDLRKTSNLRVISGLPLAFRSLSAMFQDQRGGCGICGIHSVLGVLSNGSYALCGIGESTDELVFGDARSVSLEDVWNHNPVLNDIRTHLPRDLKGVCAECVMKWRCLGSCIAQNYYSSGDLLGDFWFCHSADDSGLFPDSRKIPART
ncbi:MAG: SynChlorMet cassette radical SAM/SPASM protein ScmF [Methanomicrobiales archaeon]